jgi:1-acyl-sn-glycerol-3-phosphate acyltransferase
LKSKTGVGRALRAAQSVVFFAVYAVFMILFFGLPQRLIVWPAAILLPSYRVRIVGLWFYMMARATQGMARFIADVRIDYQGIVPPGPCVVLMNHQSLLDIPIGYSIVRHPYPLIPTRALYARGVPGVSPLIRMGELPLVGQKSTSRRFDIKEMARAAEKVAKGTHSLLIFPEGHRTKDGEISPFMRSGLQLILTRVTSWPVYLIVVDGLWHARTTADALFTFAGTRAKVRVLGPFPPPAKDAIESFSEEMRAKMVAALAEMRA